MNLELADHVAVVTGGAGGIGLACAQKLAQEGCRVAVWDLAAAPTVASFFRKVDVAKHGEVEAALKATEHTLGPCQHLIHAAAVGSGKFGFPFTHLSPADWTRVLEINILGMVNVANAFAPGMVERRFGTMVFLASVAGQIGSQTDPPYSASKAANINFAQCLAKDLAKHNIRVNTVSPGMVRTPLNRRVWESWNGRQPGELRRSYDEWAEEKILAVAPLGRWQEPEDIADMVTFLSSARAAQITGQCMNVDGGQVMHS